MNVLRLPLPLVVLLCAGCTATVGDSEDGPVIPPPPGPGVRIQPATAYVVTGATYTFLAQVTGLDDPAVTWTLDPAAGTIQANGVFHASTTHGTYALTATSVQDGTRHDTAYVTIVDPSPVDPSGLMPADRFTVWDPGIPGGIPSATTVFRTIDAAAYGNNRTDAAATINAAIQAAGAVATAENPQVVALPPGNYRVSVPVLLNRNHVVLRGAGPGLTRIIGPQNQAASVRLGYKASYGPVMNFTATAPKGSRTIALADASTIRAGDVLQIDQQDGSAVATGEGHYWNGFVFMGDGHYEKRQPSSDLHGPGFGGVVWGGSGSWLQIVNWNALYGGPWRSVLQQVEVTAKSGNTITLRDPLHLSFELARRPQAFKTVSILAADPLGTRYTGLEDLTVAGGTNDNIQLINCAYCWVRHVESDGQLVANDTLRPGTIGRHIQLFHAYRCVIRDSYLHHARRIVNGGGAYGIAVEDGSSANLIENNIAVWLNKPVVMNVSGGGNVVAYNYVDNAMITGTLWQENAIDGCHQAYAHSDLFEGNMAPNIGSDATHGSAGWHVFFRNYAFGRNSFPYDVGGTTALPWQNLRAVGMDALSGPHTFVGNVLVAPNAGYGTAYQMDHANHAGTLLNASVVYRLGTNGIGGSQEPYDTGQAAANIFRHGNWDSVSNAVVWDAGYGNHTLPPSFYLTAKPGFFGDDPWPWVEPAGATRTFVLPAQRRYAAGTPNSP